MDLINKLIDKLNSMIEIRGFYISEPGDPSVGIYPRVWSLEGKFIFEDENELNAFKADLQKTFENYCGIAKIQTIDEVDEMEKQNLPKNDE